MGHGLSVFNKKEAKFTVDLMDGGSYQPLAVVIWESQH